MNTAPNLNAEQLLSIEEYDAQIVTLDAIDLLAVGGGADVISAG
jgi:hypothetical protein